MAKDRPSLKSLQSRLAGKLSGDQADKPASQPASKPASVQASEPASDPRVQIIVRMTAAERKALRLVAVQQNTNVQALLEEAIRDILSRHGS